MNIESILQPTKACSQLLVFNDGWGWAKICFQQTMNVECGTQRLALCNVWLPRVMMQRLQATAMEKSQTFQSSSIEQNISRRKYCDLSLDRSVFSLVTLEGWFYLNSYFLIFRNRNILKLWEVSLSQLLDWTEDCWSLAQARWGRQPRPLIGQYWGNTGLSLVESLQPGPVKLHQQQCAMKLGNFVVNYIKSTFKIVPAK